MEILDIVHRAVQRSQVIPGFNPSECPEDIEERVSDILTHELIPDLNCDRTLDLTETVMPFTPRHGIIDLCCPPGDANKFIVMLPFDSKYLLEQDDHGMYANMIAALQAIGMTDSQPKTPTGELIPLGVWSSDWKFIDVPAVPVESIGAPYELSVNPVYNVPFPPMCVEGVVEASTGCELDYKHAIEFISAEFRHARFVFMTELYENKLRVRFNPEFGDLPVQIVLPVPVTYVNYLDSPRPWSGKIVAPMKFRNYLITSLAFRIASEYGVATAAELKTASDGAYNMLAKNRNKKQHAMDFNRKISETLRRPVNTTISSAGFYGGSNG